MKKLFFCAAIVAAAVFGVMKATEVNNTMTDLQMENVEALANGGDDNSDPDCKPRNGRYCIKPNSSLPIYDAKNRH